MVRKISLGSNIASLGAQRSLSDTTKKLSSVYERLSSGQRINKSSDDAAGLSIANSLSADKKIYTQGIRNFNDGLSLLSIADSAIASLSEITVRLTELAEQAANSVLGNKQREALDEEAQALSAEYLRIIQSTEFNNRQLLSGNFGNLRLQGGYGLDGSISGNMGGAVGRGTFSSAIAAATGVTGSLIDADFNGDGIVDFASTQFLGSSVNIYKGNGGTSFTQTDSISSGLTTINTINYGDLNSDGIMDIVAGGVLGGVGAISVILGNGDGTFQDALTSVSVGGTEVNDVEIGDMNDDGFVDIITSFQNGANAYVGVSLGNGQGGVQGTVSYDAGVGTAIAVELGDLNDDGLLDVVSGVSGTPGFASVLIGTGSGSLAANVQYTLGTGGITDFELADLNSDGILDVVSVGNSELNVSLGNSDGTFQSSTTYSTGITSMKQVEVGDMNGDGVVDVVVSGSQVRNGAFSLLLGVGSGLLSSSPSVITSGVGGGFDHEMGLADFDNNGVLDVYRQDSGTINIHIANTNTGVSPLLEFSLKTAADAKQALPVFKQKLNQLSSQRGQIGAFMSRLETGINSLTSTAENLSRAESFIRDADIAEETANLTRLSILQRASSAILAQANNQSSIALKLLSD